MAYFLTPKIAQKPLCSYCSPANGKENGGALG
jgi:hypothetical protein